MGDRSGLPKIDRTNGYDDGRDYMRVKKSKLAQQNDEIRQALRNRNSTSKSDLFKGVSINVNGRTQPTADELKRLILLNGGDYHPYYRYQTTKFMIATNLSTARMKTLRPDDRVVRPEWITDSIEAKCLLPYEDYQLFVEQARGKETVRPIERMPTRSSDGQSTSKASDGDEEAIASVVESYSSSYRKNSKNKSSQEPTKSRDIREMFSKCVRSIDKDEGGKKKLFLTGSQSSMTSDNSNDSISRQTITSKQQIELSNQESNQSTASGKDFKDVDKTSRSSDSQEKSAGAKKKTLTMSDFVVKGAKPNRFPAPKVKEKRNSMANICGLTDLDQIIALLNEWVGCVEGVKDDDTACVTKFFFDLMNEKDYHNRLYEILDAFQLRVIQHDEPIWINVYNNLVQSIKSELNQGSEASQNLYQLLTLIESPGSSGLNNSQLITPPSLPTIPEIDID